MTALTQTLLLAQWQFRRQAQFLPLLVVVQVFMAIATVIGYGLLVGDPSPEIALYLATGAPTVTLITVGLVMTPQVVAQSKTEGSFDWMRTLPVPRSAFLCSDLLVWTLIALPGMVLGVIAGALRFNIALSPAPWVVGAAILVSITAASVGYAMATLLPPAVSTLMTQMLIFIVMLFSPVSYPADRLPAWLATVHEFLPIEPMAQLIRAGLASNDFSLPLKSMVVLGAWCLASLGGAILALRRQA
ncbi:MULTISPECIES: ABC transporter permease [unclassified Cryobacterium]|uniref:ABC transporter permease n=1 Tax=unclassified Cryobacterium TaxID=2649013 RepID=UPI002B2340DA|nr:MULTISPECIES: ABC transporter permease [unclassified Cryobacterium]MEB0001033.1 ABC transporter permease [Cryobacterium sp. RTS3]MEB0267588.1 ABC transporter permease [Cryobacterium sp. 10I5]